jgi:anti-sigma factor RsiW
MEFEGLLADYETLGAVERGRVEAHLARCEACRAWLEAFAEADAALRATYAGVRAPATLAASVQRRVSRAAAARERRVSAVPEVLDFIGWFGVIGACSILAYFWLPQDAAFSQTVLFALCGILLCAALSVTVWALRGEES